MSYENKFNDFLSLKINLLNTDYQYLADLNILLIKPATLGM